MTTQQQILRAEARRTSPDFEVYIPGSFDGSTNDNLNEHFIVFETRDGALTAIWTQSGMPEGHRDFFRCNRILCGKSRDGGRSWSAPWRVVGPMRIGDEGMTSWAVPMVTDSGRVYVLYSRNIGIAGWVDMHTGVMEGVYSDDHGASWSAPQRIDMGSSSLDDPAGIVPPEWIIWQRPLRALDGGFVAGYTRWISPGASYFTDWAQIAHNWTWVDSVTEFMRFTNMQDNPEPRDIKIELCAHDKLALRVPHYLHPEMSNAQEPSIVRLPDDRLFCVMRTCTGYIWWSQSRDDGRTWSLPTPLLYRDFGRPVLNPVVADPIYPLSDGRYLLLYCNHRGYKQGKHAESNPRNPLFAALGEFRPDAQQPVWFSEPRLFMDTGNISINAEPSVEGNTIQNPHLAMYASFTNRDGEDILWYPDRKAILLGRRITRDFLAGMDVPSVP